MAIVLRSLRDNNWDWEKATRCLSETISSVGSTPSASRETRTQVANIHRILGGFRCPTIDASRGRAPRHPPPQPENHAGGDQRATGDQDDRRESLGLGLVRYVDADYQADDDEGQTHCSHVIFLPLAATF